MTLSDPLLVKIQAASGLIFGTYLGLHLTNTFAAHFGYLAYDGVQACFRTYYQNRFVEIGVIAGAGIIHFGSSGLRFFRRRARIEKVKSQNSQDEQVHQPSKRKNAQERTVQEADVNDKNATEPSSWKKWISKYIELSPLAFHRYSGYFLATVIGGHVLATRIATLLMDIEIGAKGLNFTLVTFPGLFIPYYMIFAICGLYHLTYGTIQALKLFKIKVPRILTPSGPLFYPFIAVGTAVCISSVLALGGAYYPVPQDQVLYYQQKYEAIFPHFLLPWKRV